MAAEGGSLAEHWTQQHLQLLFQRGEPSVTFEPSLGPGSMSGTCVAELGPARTHGNSDVSGIKMALTIGNYVLAAVVQQKGLEAGRGLSAGVGLSIGVEEPRSRPMAKHLTRRT
eukprot:g45330.t1